MIKLKRPVEGFKEKIIPSLSILKKQPVIVKDGQYSFLNGEESTVKPEAVLKELLDIYSRVHILDLMGVERDTPQWDVIKSLADIGPIWVDVGSSTADGVIDIIMAGAEAAVLSLRFVENLDEIANALELTDNILIQIDIEEKILGPQRLRKFRGIGDLVEELYILGVRRIIINDHKNPPDLISVRSGVEMWWAAKGFEDGENVLNAGYNGSIIALSDLIEEE